MGEVFDAPNKQAVGLDPPWVEGTGGGPGVEPTINPLDDMTKAELLEHAASLGVTVDESATKAEVRAVIDQAEGR